MFCIMKIVILRTYKSSPCLFSWWKTARGILGSGVQEPLAATKHPVMIAAGLGAQSGSVVPHI